MRARREQHCAFPSRPPSLVSDASGSSSRPSSMNSNEHPELPACSAASPAINSCAFPTGGASSPPQTVPLASDPTTSISDDGKKTSRPKLLTRLRRTSLPSMAAITSPRSQSNNRLSTASTALSIESLPEDVDTPYAFCTSPSSTSPQPLGSSFSTASASAAVGPSAASTSSKAGHRLSLPASTTTGQRPHIRARKKSFQRSHTDPSPSLSAHAQAAADRQATKRRHLTQELVDTEHAYVDTLNKIEEHFLAPLLAQANSSATSAFGRAPTLERKGISEIFSNFSDVLVLAREVLRRLQQGAGTPKGIEEGTEFPLHEALTPFEAPAAVRNDNPGALLLPLCPFMKCYSMFIQNFSAALERLYHEERHSEKWRRFVDERKQLGLGKGLGLADMLLNIVQRIPRYRLLLEGLLKVTPPDHPDVDDLRQACTIVGRVAESVNGRVEQHADTRRLLELQASFIDLDSPLIAPGRRLVKFGPLLKSGRKDEQMRHFFLFSDIIIYGAQVESTSGWSRAMSMTNLAAALSPNDSRPPLLRSNSGFSSQQYTSHRRLPLKDITVAGIDGNSFEIRSSERSFAVTADSPSSKNEWMNGIREAKNELLGARVTLNTDTIKQARRRSLSTPRFAALPQFAFEPVASPIIEEVPSLSNSPMPSPGLSSSPATPGAELLSKASEETEGSGVDSPTPKGLASSSTVPTLMLSVAWNYSAPVWVPDSKAARCMRCQNAFGLWLRKHHCRLCGHVICWECSNNSFVIPALQQAEEQDTRARACDDCFHSCFGSEDTKPPPSPQLSDKRNSLHLPDLDRLQSVLRNQ